MIITGSHSGVGTVGMQENDGGAAGVDNPNQSFNYLSIDPNAPDPEAFLPTENLLFTRQVLVELGEAMIESSDHDTPASTIPPAYTYWGQFIDHDITAGTDRPSNSGTGGNGNGFNLLGTDIFEGDFAPQDPKEVQQKIFNLRLPELDLDSVYGGGPEDFETIQVGIFAEDKLRLKVGENHDRFPGATPNDHLPDPLKRDLPRGEHRRAKIADDRNDENTIVAQFHTAMLRFHNAVADEIEKDESIAPGDRYARTRQLVTWTYQWLVVNDYLKTICMDGIVDDLVYANETFFDTNGRFMPLEFSVAGFRFGHSMIRSAYDFNQNFPNAFFNNLFTFTGLKGDMLGSPTLPNNWIIDWSRFTDKHSAAEMHFARRIDTNLSFGMTMIPGDVDPETGKQKRLNQLTVIEKQLAVRNLLRGYLLSIPTGEHVARHFGLTPLTPSQLADGLPPNTAAKQSLETGVLSGKTPLWYYILKEAEVQTDGNCLGEVGSHVVAGTLIGLLKKDANSYLNAPGGWTPNQGMRLSNGKPIVRIHDLFTCAGVA